MVDLVDGETVIEQVPARYRIVAGAFNSPVLKGTLTLTDKRVIFEGDKRTTKGNRTIPIRQITSTDYKESGALARLHISIATGVEIYRVSKKDIGRFVAALQNQLALLS